MPSCARMLDGRSLSEGGSRASRRREGQLRTDHVKSEAKGPRQKDLTSADHRSPGQEISGVHPYAISWLTADIGTRLPASAPESDGAPKIENSGGLVAMGSDGSLTSPGTNGSTAERIKESGNPSPKSPSPTFVSSHVTIIYDDMPEMVGPVVSSSASGRQYQAINHELDETFNDADQRRRSRVRELEALLLTLRSRNLDTRTRAHRSRRELGEIRLEMNAADHAHMALVREELIRERDGIVENKRTESSIDEYELKLENSFKRLQAARDEYGPLEDTYDALEALLNRQEHEVTKVEKQISKYNALGPEDQDDSDSLSSASEDSDLEDLQHLGNLYPSYNQYMSRLGDAGILQEDLADLGVERNRLQEQQVIRSRIGEDLLPEDQEILVNFPDEEARIQNELDNVNADVERLRLQCIQEGLLDDRVEDSILGSSGLLLKETQDESIESANEVLPISPTQSEYSRFPILLEKPCDTVDREKSDTLIADFKIGNTGDRIECWLLHKLRSSCAEVELLARFSTSTFETFKGVGPESAKDPEMWQEEVLEFWFFDSTNMPPTAYEIKPTAMISPAEFTVKADATADTNTATLQPQSTIQSELLTSNSLRSSLQSEVSTCNSPHPTTIPLPPSPQPSAIPLPPSPLPFKTPLAPFTLPGALPAVPSTISTTSTTSNDPLSISTIPSPASTLPSPLLSPLPLPPLNAYFSPSLIAEDKNEDIFIVNGDGSQGQETHRTVLPLSNQSSGRYKNKTDSSEIETNSATQTDPYARPDADTYRVELLVRSSVLGHNQKNPNRRRLDFGLLLKLRMEYPLGVA